MKNALYLIVLLFLPASLNAQQYYTVPEVLAYLFPKSESVDPEKKTLDEARRKSVRAALRDDDVKKDWTVYVATSGKTVDGYAIVDNVLGKERPITYVVKISPGGAVVEVEIVEYRESHGGEVKNEAFRRQFAGKTAADPVKVGQDVRHVSGATISSKSVAFGVKRAIAVWTALYGK